MTLGLYRLPSRSNGSVRETIRLVVAWTYSVTRLAESVNKEKEQRTETISANTELTAADGSHVANMGEMDPFRLSGEGARALPGDGRVCSVHWVLRLSGTLGQVETNVSQSERRTTC